MKHTYTCIKFNYNFQVTGACLAPFTIHNCISRLQINDMLKATYCDMHVDNRGTKSVAVELALAVTLIKSHALACITHHTLTFELTQSLRRYRWPS